jgi:hypothetical protein
MKRAQFTSVANFLARKISYDVNGNTRQMAQIENGTMFVMSDITVSEIPFGGDPAPPGRY